MKYLIRIYLPLTPISSPAMMSTFRSSEATLKSAELVKLVIDTLDKNKAVNITELDVSDLTDITDYMVICTATSNRHAKTLSDKVAEAAKMHGVKPYGVEGEEEGEWVLLDLSDVVIHIMLKDVRDFYSLEKLWTVTEKILKKSNS